MPSLKKILKDMLVVAANGGNLEGLDMLDTTTFRPPKPSPSIAGPKSQSIWYWEKGPKGSNPGDPGYLGQVTHLNCWSRSMAESHNDDGLGWMTVCRSVTWSPVKVDVKVGKTAYRLTLPLTEMYVVKTLSLHAGHNPGKGWWPLEADVDSSFIQVFVYDITGKTSADVPDPVDPEVYDHDEFMPDPSGPAVAPLTVSPGEQLDLTVLHRHYVCVVMSLVCCGERADFEPGALVGVARVVPHFMIMTNLPVDGIQASIRIERPELSGYYGTSVESARAPMQHADMDPPIKGLAVADTNLFRAADMGKLVNIPFWDLIFDYVIDAPDGNLIKVGDSLHVVKDEPNQRTERAALGFLNYETVAKAARGAVAGVLGVASLPLTGVSLVPMLKLGILAGTPDGTSAAFTRPSIRLVHRNPNSSATWTTLSALTEKIYGSAGLAKADLLPRKKADVLKWARQGEFDSIHLAPRMKANLLLGRPDLSSPEYATTLGEIRMAPFCEHDCLHTHWRWGANWNDDRMTLARVNEKPLAGFSTITGASKFAGVGVPYTEIGAPLVPRNQEVSVSFESSHAFNYSAKTQRDITPGVWQAMFHHGSAYAVSIVKKNLVGVLVDSLTASPVDGIFTPQFSEFYWTLRYQDTVDGPLARIDANDATITRLMRL